MLNKKGIIFDEGIWIAKLILMFILIGIVVTFVIVASGVDLGSMMSTGWSSLWSANNGTVGGNFTRP
jgi:uncharacterized membrane protein